MANNELNIFDMYFGRHRFVLGPEFVNEDKLVVVEDCVLENGSIPSAWKGCFAYQQKINHAASIADLGFGIP